MKWQARACYALGIGFAIAMPANAQTVAEGTERSDQAREPSTPPAVAGDEIVVTGSQIRGVAPVGSALISLGRDAIAQSATATTGTTADFLREIPQISSLGPDDTRSGGGQGAQQNISRGTSLNLRGIGPTATLMLVNGKRLSPSGSHGTFADPTVISTDAIDRIEVVGDGASAIYGSDAIAGVVNIILRRRFDGIQLSGSYGLGDGFDQYKVSGVAGTDWNSGSVVATFEYNKRGALDGRDRAYFRQDLRSFGGGDYRSPNSAPGNLSISGVNYALPAGPGTSLTAAEVAAGRGKVNRSDISADSQIFPEQTRYNATLSVVQTLADGLDLEMFGIWARRSFQALTVPVGNITVPSTNPFFVSPVAGATSGIVNYNFLNDVGRTPSRGSSEKLEANVDLKIAIGKSWQLTLSGGYGDDWETIDNDDAFTTAAAVINPLLRDPNRETSLNLFGDGTANNPATLQKLFFADTTYHVKATRRALGGHADGPLFTLPGGDVRAAIGYDWRQESQAARQTNNTGATLLPAVTQDLYGRRSVHSVFGEVYVPIVGAQNASAGLQKLDLSLAGRWDRYGDVGTAWNPKVGLNYAPVRGVTFHASYGTSFRAPLLLQVNPVITSNTAAVTFQVDPASPTGRSYTLVRVGGNPDLRPETAKTFSFGVDVEPVTVPGLRASANYFYVDYKDKIGQVAGAGATTILTTPALYAPFIKRDPTVAEVAAIIAAAPALAIAGIDPAAVKVLIDGRSNNLGRAVVDGIDFDLRYTIRSGSSRVDLGLNGIYYFGYKNQNRTTLPLVDSAGLINFPTRYRLQGRIGWGDDTGKVTLIGRYTPSYRNNLVTPAQVVDDNVQFDLAGSVKLERLAAMLGEGELSFSVQNLLNTTPPFVNNPAGYGYDPQNYSPIGRVVSLQLVKRFN